MADTRNLVVLVDERDRETGTMDKLLAHQNGGMLHRAFSIFVFNRGGELLLQRRAMAKYHTPGKWTNTCCSHPFPGESVMDAAHRRLVEEMGFDCPMKEEFSFTYLADVGNGLTENEYDHVVFGAYEPDPKPNPDEVMAFRWVGLDELKDEIASNPADFTPWIAIIVEKVAERRKANGSGI